MDRVEDGLVNPEIIAIGSCDIARRILRNGRRRSALVSSPRHEAGEHEPLVISYLE